MYIIKIVFVFFVFASFSNADIIPIVSVDIDVVSNINSPISITASNDDIYVIQSTSGNDGNVLKIENGIVSNFSNEFVSPTSLIVDETGIVSNTSNSILVGGSFNSDVTLSHQNIIYKVNSPPSYQYLFSIDGSFGQKIYDMDFDSSGNLFISTDNAVWKMDQYLLNGAPSLFNHLFPVPTRQMVIDDNNNVYIRGLDNIVRLYDESGTLLSDSLNVNGQIEYSGSGSFDVGLYSLENGILNEITGDVKTPIITGFDNGDTIYFNNGTLYVSQFENDQVLIINKNPEPNTIILFTIAIILSCLTRFDNAN